VVFSVHRRLFVMVSAAALVAGCEGMQRKDHVARLDQSLAAYAGAVRWGNFETAGAFAVPRSGSVPPVNHAALSTLKVTGYSVRINRINEAGDEADVSLSFTYYHEDRGTVGRADQDVTWYWSDARAGWLMDGALPDFGR
jgi:hypothetical protein